MAVTKNLLNIGDAQITGVLTANTIKLASNAAVLLKGDGTTISLPGTTTTFLRGDGTFQYALTSVTLNGQTNTSPSFYAPTSLSNGKYLKSTSSGVTWDTPTDTKVTQSSSSDNEFRPVLFSYSSTPSDANIVNYNSSITINPNKASLKITSCILQYNSTTKSLDFNFV